RLFQAATVAKVISLSHGLARHRSGFGLVDCRGAGCRLSLCKATMKHFTALASLALACAFQAIGSAKDWVTYEGKDGPGKGKHVVLLSGDEEYRSEEA